MNHIAGLLQVWVMHYPSDTPTREFGVFGINLWYKAIKDPSQILKIMISKFIHTHYADSCTNCVLCIWCLGQLPQQLEILAHILAKRCIAHTNHF